MQELRSKPMRIASSYIYLSEMRVHAHHGVMPQETKVGADFIVNIRVGCDIARAMETDDVADTVSYADLCAIVKAEMDKPSKLVEHVAGRIAKAIFDAYGEITTIDLAITKRNPPMGADCDGAGVEVHATRAEQNRRGNTVP